MARLSSPRRRESPPPRGIDRYTPQKRTRSPIRSSRQCNSPLLTARQRFYSPHEHSRRSRSPEHRRSSHRSRSPRRRNSSRRERSRSHVRSSHHARRSRSPERRDSSRRSRARSHPRLVQPVSPPCTQAVKDPDTQRRERSERLPGPPIPMQDPTNPFLGRNATPRQSASIWQEIRSPFTPTGPSLVSQARVPSVAAPIVQPPRITEQFSDHSRFDFSTSPNVIVQNFTTIGPYQIPAGKAAAPSSPAMTSAPIIVRHKARPPIVASIDLRSNFIGPRGAFVFQLQDTERVSLTNRQIPSVLNPTEVEIHVQARAPHTQEGEDRADYVYAGIKAWIVQAEGAIKNGHLPPLITDFFRMWKLQNRR